MGGTALGYPTLRLSRQDYATLAQKCVSTLRLAFPNARIDAIPAYREKPDFGDLDILVEQGMVDCQAAAGLLGAISVVENGTVISMGVRVRPFDAAESLDVFQVDLIQAPSASFGYSLAYFAFNDLGNLVGYIARMMGLVHRHDGLYYYLREGNQLVREILLTQDYGHALDTLGLDASRFGRGFATLDEMFTFVAGSKHFKLSPYLNEQQNNKHRARDRKRKTLQLFRAWCEARSLSTQPERTLEDWQAIVNTRYPHLAREITIAQHALRDQRAIRSRLDTVATIVPLQGKALGALTAAVRADFSTTEALREFVLGASDATFAERVLQVHRKQAL